MIKKIKFKKTKFPKIKFKSKRGVSALVATALLIFITVMAVGLVAYFIIPMIKDSLSTSQACNNARISVDTQRGYTCYRWVEDEETGELTKAELQFMVTREAQDFELKGILVSVGAGGSSKTFKIKKDTKYPWAKNWGDAEYGNKLILPGPGEQRTYIINLLHEDVNLIQSKPTTVGVFPIILVGEKEETCSGSAPPINIKSCTT